MQPNFMFCWPHARMGVASYQDLQRLQGSEGNEETLMVQEYQYPTAAMMHDGVILPSETRKVTKVFPPRCYTIQCTLLCRSFSSV